MNQDLSAVPTAELEKELEKREDRRDRRCPTCSGRWGTYKGVSKGLFGNCFPEDHCLGCRQPVQNCTC